MLCLGIEHCLRVKKKKKDCFAEVSFPFGHIARSLTFSEEYWQKSTHRIEFIDLGLITTQTRSIL